MHDEQTLTLLAKQAAEIVALNAVAPLIRELATNSEALAANLRMLERMELKQDESIRESRMHLARVAAVEEKGRAFELRMGAVEVDVAQLPKLIKLCENYDARLLAIENLSQQDKEQLIEDRRAMLQALEEEERARSEEERLQKTIHADDVRGRMSMAVGAIVALAVPLGAGIKFLWEHLHY